MECANVALSLHNCPEAKSLTREVRPFYSSTGTDLRLQKEDLAMDFPGESTPSPRVEGDAKFQTHLPTMWFFY